ncbi:MAG: tetratricopeptide repeat protein [Spirochaetaceae bacterium]|nr:tetratricopeptide repeat protein [Spirochaetaceae bacterium]
MDDATPDFSKANQNFDRVIETNPNNVMAHFQRGQSYFLANNFDEAISEFNSCIDLLINDTYTYEEYEADELPTISDAYYMCGRSYAKRSFVEREKDYCGTLQNYNFFMQNLITAIEYLDKASEYKLKNDAEIYDGHGIIYFSMAECEKMNGNNTKANDYYHKAIDCFKVAVDINPNDGYIYYGLGNAYEGLEKRKEAMDAFRKALSLDPENNNFAKDVIAKLIELEKEGIDVSKHY